MIALFLSLHSLVFAMPNNWKGHSPNLLTPVKIDGLNVYEIWVSAGGDELLIDQNQFLELMKNILLSNHYIKMEAQRSDQNYFTKNQIEEFGIKIQFDLATLNLYLNVPLSLRKENSIDFLNRNPNLGTYITASEFSYYLNFNYNNSFTDGISNQEQLNNELNLNFKGHVLNSGGFYSSSNRKRYHREYTRYSYDFIQNNARFILGDLNHNIVDLQEQYRGMGFTLQNDFSINPTILRTNFNQYEIVLNSPSLVEIFINESRIYRAQHNAGPLNLNRLPLCIGMNDIKILVTNSSGRTETYRYQTNYHNNLLPKSVRDYSVSVLVPSSFNSENDLEYDSEEKFFTGFYRLGLTDSFTYGLNFQGQDTNNLAGFELSKAFSRLLLQTFYTNSYYDSQNSGSYMFTIQNNPSPTNFRPIRLNASYRYFEKDFTYSTGAKNNIHISQILSSSYILNSASSFGIGLESRLDYNDDQLEFTNLEYIYRLNVNTNFSLKTQIDNKNS